MDSRERVLRALSFGQPDRVAVDLGSHRSSGIAAMAYARLRDYLGLPKRLPRVYDMPQQLAIIDEDVLERFGVDCIELGRAFNEDEADWKPWGLPDGTPCLIPRWIEPIRDGAHWVIKAADGTPIAIQKAGVPYFEQLCFPLLEDPRAKLERLEDLLQYDMWEALASPPGPTGPNEDRQRYLAEGARRLRERSSRAIVGLFGAPLFEGGQQLMRMDTFYALLAAEPELAERFLDRLLQLYMCRLESFLDAVGPYIDIILFSDDYGMQTGPQISPQMYRRYFKPRHQQMWSYAKQRAPVKVLLHSCGSIRALLPDMIEAGLDAVNPVQISARGMDPGELKAELGGRIVFWGGGCDTQRVLPQATPEEVRRHVWHNLDRLAPGGGFVFQQVHNIQSNVPPENIVAMFDAVAEWRR